MSLFARARAAMVAAARSAPGAAADAALAGWLAVALVHAVCAERGHAALDAGQRGLYHVYDTGQLVGLGALAWVLTRLAWRLRPRVRALAALAAFWLGQSALLQGDLESFALRMGDDDTPWHVAFGLGSALVTLACSTCGLALAGGARRLAGVLIGIAAAAANHWVLPLDYPGAHLIAAWAAAGLIGASLIGLAARMQLARDARAFAACILVASSFSYAIVPGAVVRSALLGTPGAVAAPFAASAWTALRSERIDSHARRDPEWFTPRAGRPDVAAERLPGAPEAPIVLLLTVDALRADVVDARSARRKIVPNLLAMSERALRFEHVWSPASYTMASLRSLFSGVYYSQQPGRGAEKLRAAMGQRRKLRKGAHLPRLLERHGVRTLSLKTHRDLARDKGICRGFGEEIDLGHATPSDRIVDTLLERLGPDARGPLFVYTHFLDPHTPYDRGRKRGTAWQRYLAEVSLVDAAIGRLRRALRERGLDRRSYLLVTADHAEAFGEHGHDFHATTLYEEMIRVPLLIEGPGVAPRRVQEPVSLIDLAPTVLSLFGVPTPGHFMGQSLVPFMRGRDPRLDRPLAADGSRGIRALLLDRRWKAIVDSKRGSEELYDLKSDPAERRNLAERPEAREHLDTLRAFFAGLSQTVE